ncbi:hypothetical protein Ptr902_03426 [Pyrenophora tritici-repentis]|nr:hypothetical protein Ptr902_03426 [Pyrenophora tritici-repentis]
MAPSTAMDAIPKLQADGSNAYHWEAALKLYANIHSIGGLLDGSYMVTYLETPHYQTEPTTTSSAFNTPQLLLNAQQRFILAINNAYPDYGRDRCANLRRNVTLNVDRMCSELINEAHCDDLIKTINTSI